MPIGANTSLANGTYKADWGTPPEIIDLVVRAAGQPVYCDLASSEEHNKRIGAEIFYSTENPCPTALPECRGLLWCNPPGPGKNILSFFARWMESVHRNIYPAAFLLFNLDHLRYLVHADYFNITVLRKRIKFVGAKHQNNFPSAIIWSGLDYRVISREGPTWA